MVQSTCTSMYVCSMWCTRVVHFLLQIWLLFFKSVKVKGLYYKQFVHTCTHVREDICNVCVAHVCMLYCITYMYHIHTCVYMYTYCTDIHFTYVYWHTCVYILHTLHTYMYVYVIIVHSYINILTYTEHCPISERNFWSL